MKQRGFTIVELLVVIIVIAILATITIVTYRGIQDRARASAASTALSQASKKLALFKIDSATSSYPTTGNLSSAGVTDSDTTYQYTSADGSSYCLTATSGTISYYIDSTTHMVPTVGGCPGHGQGGVSAITNLATDPRATTYVTTGLGWKTGRWAGSAPATASYSLVTGAVDGPVGITTYIRKTWTVAPAALGNTGDTGFDTTATKLAVSDNEVYTISCYVRPSVIRNFNIGVYQYTSAGAAFTTARSYGPNVTGAASQWTRVSYAYTVPVGVGQVAIVCDSNANSTGGAVVWAVGSTLDGTGLMITSGSTLYNYADGNSANWVWNGTANASTSTGPPL